MGVEHHSRSSAQERREEILDAAIAEFARYGLYGTSVDAIAKRLEISQPYVFRLFGTKKQLFVAASVRVCNRIERAFAEAVTESPERPLASMGKAYGRLLESRSELLLLLQAFAASEDEEIREPVARRYMELWHSVSEMSHASEAEVREFFAQGMGMTVGSALRIEDLYLPLGEDSACD